MLYDDTVGYSHTVGYIYIRERGGGGIKGELVGGVR